MTLSAYVPIIGLFGLATAFAVISLLGARLAGPRRPSRAKLDPYECGIEPTPQPTGGSRIPVKYYLTAMMFIIFDIEVIFLVPWAIAFDQLALGGFLAVLLFIVAVGIAYLYEWRRGGLEWD
ncbi:MAG TPA: NADH-quinone oxidoreductase subunit A [Natronosporangium sp.]|nr:NADH-quinone oxidoreductase subunit A [Natronosporangium sp.]